MSNPSDRVRVRRNARRAECDPQLIGAALDANRVFHVACMGRGEPRIIPTHGMREAGHLCDYELPS